MAVELAAQGETLEAILLGRLAEAGLPDEVRAVVLAALGGADELNAVLTEELTPPRDLDCAEPVATGPVAGVYLSSIGVEGFRGIGKPATLNLAPGPGLILITGRNGSGKSSFAESVELAMTGENKRWAPPRSAIWRDGWRNLHHQEATRIGVELVVDGHVGTTRVVRSWAAGDALDAGESFGQPPGEPQCPLAEMGWGRALELYRPFLSYAELGALVDGKPSEMYDAMARILGLDELAGIEKLLSDTRKDLESTVKAAAGALPELRQLLAGSTEPRVERVRTELAARTPDLAVLGAIVSEGVMGDDGPGAETVEAVLGIAMPDAEAVQVAVAELSAARAAVAALAGGNAEDARRLVSLLETALEQQQRHPDTACPVCAGRALDQAWADGTRAEVSRLRVLAMTAENTHREYAAALTRLRQLVGPLPAALSVEVAGLDPDPVLSAWRGWLSIATTEDVDSILEGAQAAHRKLAERVLTVQIQARALIQERIAAWEPIALALSDWLGLARRAAQARRSSVPVKAAIVWLKDAGQDIRDARLAPFAQTSAKVWAQLRQESNVELGPIHLSGISTSSQRKVALDVTIDGKPGAALAVMSQGELHALGLALFLPRAAATVSPFRFLVIDDPVQSMDPAKVDGLARVLADVARDRQVVVFSHDDRLAEAVRRLHSPATIWEVVRGEGSAVRVIKNDDPIGRYLSDARAMAKTDQLSVQARALVVVGMCRGALEAACHQRIRAQKFAAGVRHAQIERDLDDARTLRQAMALALFDDSDSGAAVVPELAAEYGGQPAVRAFNVCKSGVHEPYQGDLMALVNDVKTLAAKVRP